jgi:hypothetical protein
VGLKGRGAQKTQRLLLGEESKAIDQAGMGSEEREMNEAPPHTVQMKIPSPLHHDLTLLILPIILCYGSHELPRCTQIGLIIHSVV